MSNAWELVEVFPGSYDAGGFPTCTITSDIAASTTGECHVLVALMSGNFDSFTELQPFIDTISDDIPATERDCFSDYSRDWQPSLFQGAGVNPGGTDTTHSAPCADLFTKLITEPVPSGTLVSMTPLGTVAAVLDVAHFKGGKASCALGYLEGPTLASQVVFPSDDSDVVSVPTPIPGNGYLILMANLWADGLGTAASCGLHFGWHPGGWSGASGLDPIIDHGAEFGAKTSNEWGLNPVTHVCDHGEFTFTDRVAWFWAVASADPFDLQLDMDSSPHARAVWFPYPGSILGPDCCNPEIATLYLSHAISPEADAGITLMGDGLNLRGVRVGPP